MAGRYHLLVLGLLAGPLWGQTPASAPEKKPAESSIHSIEFEQVMKALNALTPEQHKRFSENLLRWIDLPPEEKKALRSHEEFRRKRILAEVEAVEKNLGLHLSDPQRAQFLKRYTEERRKVEELLRKETEEKRRTLLRDLNQRIKTEFSEQPQATPGAPSAPAPSP